jgi:hypothetical protein
MSKELLKDREFNSNDGIEEVIAWVWNDLTFDDVQSVFYNRMSRLTRVIQHGGDYTFE